jgi:hypothetical protein
MARGLNLNGPYPVRSISGDQYVVAFSFDTNQTSDPDGVSPAVENINPAITIAYSAAGTFTVTFAEQARPQSVDYADASIRGDFPELDAKVVSYVAATGVMTIKVYDEDDTSGISDDAASTLNNVTVQVLAFCSRKA